MLQGNVNVRGDISLRVLPNICCGLGLEDRGHDSELREGLREYKTRSGAKEPSGVTQNSQY